MAEQPDHGWKFEFQPERLALSPAGRLIKPIGRWMHMIKPRASEGSQKYFFAGCGILLLLTLAFRGHGLSFSDFDTDEGVYILMAKSWLQGGLPYEAVWDSHPPALPALLAISQIIVPDPVVAARILACLAVWITACVILALALRLCGNLVASFIGALLYFVCISRPNGLPANTEIFNNCGVSTSFFILTSAMDAQRRTILKATLAAFLLGICLQIKYTVLPESVLFCSMYLLHRWHTGTNSVKVLGIAVILAAAGILPTLIFAGYFWHAGAFTAYFEANFHANLAYVKISPSWVDAAYFTASGLAPVGGCILIVFIFISRIRPTGGRRYAISDFKRVCVWVSASAIDVILPFKFYTHYFYILYPVVCVLVPLVFTAFWRNAPLRYVIIAAAIGPAASIWVIGYLRVFQNLSVDPPRIAAALIMEDAKPGDRIFVYDAHPVIYVLSNQKPLTPYVLGVELHQFRGSSGVDGFNEISRVFNLTPKFVVAPSRLPSNDTQAALDRLVFGKLACYSIKKTIGHAESVALTIFELKDSLCNANQKS